MIGRRTVAVAIAAAFAGNVAAHGPLTAGSASIWWQWELSLVVVVPLLIGGWAYCRGLARLWQRAGIGRGISRRQAGWFFLGMATLIVALVSPLDALSATSFALHMVQHLLLILVAPPLLIAGAADAAFLWALPRRHRRTFGRFTAGVGGWMNRRPGNRMILVAVATGILWAWHVPALYDLAVRNEAIHITEHVSFLVTALAFWASVLRLRPMDHADNGARILAVAAMALQGTLLGALITFASRPLYASYQGTSSLLGLSPLTDQQVAGLIMWVPPGFLYLGVAAYLFTRWLEALGRQAG